MTATKSAPEYLSGWCGVGRHDQCLGAYVGVVCSCPHHTEPAAVAVNCFFACEHVTRDGDPQAAHDAMEEHYRAAHWPSIRQIVGWAR